MTIVSWQRILEASSVVIAKMCYMKERKHFRKGVYIVRTWNCCTWGRLLAWEVVVPFYSAQYPKIQIDNKKSDSLFQQCSNWNKPAIPQLVYEPCQYWNFTKLRKLIIICYLRDLLRTNISSQNQHRLKTILEVFSDKVGMS